jgi:hypothetical protein
MPHLWLQQNDRWEPAPLSGPALALDGGALRPAAENAAAPLRLQPAGNGAWVLLARPMSGVRVNGRPVVAGIRALRDRDEIVSRGVRSFFSTETLAQAEPFPGGEAPTFCPRCKLEIDKGSPAVRCPACRSWYHQSGEFGCWLYSPTCQLCPQATPLDAGFVWEPEF